MSINTHEYRAKEGATTQWEGNFGMNVRASLRTDSIFGSFARTDIHSRHKTAGYEYVKEIKKAAVSPLLLFLFLSELLVACGSHWRCFFVQLSIQHLHYI